MISWLLVKQTTFFGMEKNGPLGPERWVSRFPGIMRFPEDFRGDDGQMLVLWSVFFFGI